MDINKLKAFVCVAKYRSFTKASEELFISQPALSKKISDFESELNAKLLIRTNRSVELTPVGIALYNEAPMILNIIDDLQKKIQKINAHPKQHLHIACTGVEYGRFTPFLHRFRLQYPDIDFNLQWCSAATARQLLLSNTADFAFQLNMEVLQEADYVEYLPFYYDYLDAVVSNYHPLVQKGYACFEDLKDEHFIAVKTSSLHLPFNYIMDYFSRKHIEFTGGISGVDSLDTLILQISAGLGVGILSHQSENIYGRMAHFIPLNCDFPCLETDLVWNRANKNPAIQTFIEFLKADNDRYQIRQYKNRRMDRNRSDT